MQRIHIRQIVWIVLLFIWMGVIFFFSSQTGEESSELSGGLTMRIIHFFWRDYDSWTVVRQEQLLSTLTYLIRKGAHFTEYAILGFLAGGVLYSGPQHRGWYFPAAWGFAALYAMSDELHQMFSDGRSPQIFDVMVDSAGALVGVTLLWVLWIVLQKGRKK